MAIEPSHAYINNPERKTFWIEVFGSDRVPIESPIGEIAEIPGFKYPQKVLKLDMKRVTEQQKQKLVAAIAKKFNITEEEVKKDLEEKGMPILDKDVTVSIDLSRRDAD